MKTIHVKSGLILALLLGVSFSVSQCSEGAGMTGQAASEDGQLKAGTSESPLTEGEVEAIRFMREEEKLARDVYTTLYEEFPLRPFLNISRSEQAHMDAVLYLIETYDLEDPVGDNPVGVFRNQELQELYDELIDRGSQSREEALRVGALIEEVDIEDLQAGLEETARNEEVIRVFSNLCRASENHLRAFVRVLRLYDVDYEPVVLERAEFDRIMGQ